jgi:sarcosine oxidase subunit gamma
VVELLETSPCAGLLPVTAGPAGEGGLRLEEAAPVALTAVLPFAGQAQALEALGLGLPEPGAARAAAGGTLRWFGQDGYLLIGGALPEGAAACAACTDQSDAWARMVLTGGPAEDVLSRLVPVDVRAAAFPEGRTCRSMLGHMNASITRTGAQAFEIMVFRSMARTAVHELAEAMGHVAARASNRDADDIG